MGWSYVQNLVVLNHPSVLKSNRNNIRANWKRQLLRPHNKIERTIERQRTTPVRVRTIPTGPAIEIDELHAVSPMPAYRAEGQLRLYKSIGAMHNRYRLRDRSNLKNNKIN